MRLLLGFHTRFICQLDGGVTVLAAWPHERTSLFCSPAFRLLGESRKILWKKWKKRRVAALTMWPLCIWWRHRWPDRDGEEASGFSHFWLFDLTEKSSQRVSSVCDVWMSVSFSPAAFVFFGVRCLLDTQQGNCFRKQQFSWITSGMLEMLEPVQFQNWE